MSSTEKIWSLIEEKENGAVKLLLDGDDSFCHQVDPEGYTLLQCAVQYDNLEIAKYLLHRGVNADGDLYIGITPLLMAIMQRHGEMIQVLLAAGADIDFEGGLGALDYAIHQYPTERVLRPLFQALSQKYSSEQIAERIMQCECWLDSAVYSRDPKIVEYMIERGVPVECSHVSDQDPLHVAVRLGDIEITKVLLKYGADIEAVDEANCTPLYYVHGFYFNNNYVETSVGRQSDKLEILKILLDLGASLTTCTEEGFFQVSPTLMQGSSEAVSLVLQSNIDFAAKDDGNGATILHLLAVNKNRGVVEVLKQHLEKFDVNAFDRLEFTPLHLAVEMGNVVMTQFLLDHGAETGSALLCAYLSFEPNLEKLHDQCVEILLQHDADPQAVITVSTNQQFTIFDDPTEGCRLSRMKLALAHLAIREKRGVTVTELICSKIDSHPDLKKYFNKCRSLLGKKISGNVSVFNLLNATGNKMAKYLNNEELVQKLTRLCHKPQLNAMYPYFYNTIRQRFSEAMVNKTLRNNVAGIICEIFDNRLTIRHLVTEMMVDCLNDQDLRKMYAVETSL